MTNEIKNVPELRFPGFSEEWKAHYLNEILEVKAGKDYKHLEKENIQYTVRVVICSASLIFFMRKKQLV